jgi:hypothetical protein
MAEDAVHHARSGRLIKAYLLTWAVLALGGLGYLGTLVWQPDFFVPAPPPSPQIAESEQAVRTATRALTEVGAMRRSVTEVQKDLGQVRQTIEQRDQHDKATLSRLSALEEQVTTLSTQMATPSAPAAKEKAQPKVAIEKSKQKTEPRPAVRVISVAPQAAARAPERDDAAQPPLETGSLPQQAPIAFGEAVVTPSSSRFFAIQLASGPSLDALRLSWSLLVERNGATLAGLQPRYVPPRREGGAYRLVAGPIPSKLEAERICGELQSGRTGCASAEFTGEPL